MKFLIEYAEGFQTSSLEGLAAITYHDEMMQCMFLDAPVENFFVIKYLPFVVSIEKETTLYLI